MSAWTLEYADYYSAVLDLASNEFIFDMTLNHLIIKLQVYSFGEHGVHLHCHNTRSTMTRSVIAQLAGAVEYIDCTSAEGMRPHQ